MFGFACVQEALEPVDYKSAGECAQKKACHGDAVVLSASGKAQDDEDQDGLYVGDEFHGDFLLGFNVLNFRILSRAANAACVQGVETGVSCSVCVEPEHPFFRRDIAAPGTMNRRALEKKKGTCGECRRLFVQDCFLAS